MEEVSRIFVYGTLKRGFCRHHTLAGEQFLGEARTAPRYRMLNVGTYPGLIEVAEEGLSIQGEVWQVRPEALKRLDAVEGTGEGLYARLPIALTIPDFEPVQAYFYLRSTAGCPDCGEVWDIDRLT